MTDRTLPDPDAELHGSAGSDLRSLEAAGTASEQLVELNALLGRGTTYSGKLHFEGRIRIEGRFSGEIRGEDILVVGEGAEIDGQIRVGVCIVTGGHVRANIRASRAIELHVPAVVVGDLHAPAIFIDRGVQFEGSCKMAPLDATPAPAGPIALPLPSPPPRRDEVAAKTVPGTPLDTTPAAPAPARDEGDDDAEAPLVEPPEPKPPQGTP
ncbi:MAG: polymer-forming cytoskeletal protein [Deltaproteobacteria bacterium]|jgi:cytoskeletal protein CcmA (bactofilin family)|nr:polymer-forming cytoskeletal protein [Deltaproteobacteria bacterium]MBW2531668.1 polymer-forming cytoskeletal protein [Deltaproteobacteria bacterium]